MHIHTIGVCHICTGEVVACGTGCALRSLGCYVTDEHGSRQGQALRCNASHGCVAFDGSPAEHITCLGSSSRLGALDLTAFPALTSLTFEPVDGINEVANGTFVCGQGFGGALLKRVTLKGNSLQSIGTTAFTGCPGLETA